MKTIKKTTFIALSLLLSASVAAGEMHTLPYGEPIVHDNPSEVYALPYNNPETGQPYKGHGPVMAKPVNAGSTDNTYHILPHGPVVVHPEGTQAQVGYQADQGAQGNVPTSYQAPVAGTPAQVGYQADQAGTQAQKGYLADTMNSSTTNAQGYIPPMVSEEDLK